jgi:NADH:ubiquinone oxidoreductase subunit 5 (subunit L)/multisubunit Na+/H+ antiporter MnhA subunit
MECFYGGGALLWIWYYCGTLDYDLIILNSTTHFSLFIILPIFIGAMGKSAQIFFHVWLADAMEGPTPVSALIHAATLVTAGIYLMIRFAPFIAGSDIITLVGCCTAFMAALFAFFQTDLKRVIAFSTCSQLGYMMVSVSLGEFGADASIAHLMSHASFKAALFLAAGVIILATGGQQNLTRFGGLSNAHSSFFCLLTLFFASLCLVAFPETSGFYTKEVILNLSYSFVNAGSFACTYYAHTLLSITAFLTATYSAKLFYLCFLYDYSGSLLDSSPRSSNLQAHSYKKHGSTNILLIVAMSLLIFDIVFKIWVGTNLIDGILFFVPWVVKTLPFALVIAGLLSATAFASANNNFLFIIRFTATRWGFDQLYARSFVNMVLRISWAAADKGLFIVPSIKI